MTPPLILPAVDLRPLWPMLVIALTATVVLLLDLIPPRERKDHLGFVSALGVVAALVVTYWMTFAGAGELRGFRGMVVLDAYALFFNIVIGYATGLMLLLSMDYIRREGQEAGYASGLVEAAMERARLERSTDVEKRRADFPSQSHDRGATQE